MPPDQYSENTTDVSGRGQGSEQPYVPAPALPSMHAAPPLENGFPPAQAAVTMRAENDVAVSGETAEQVVKMLDMLEDLDDVQNVYHNAEIEGE